MEMVQCLILAVRLTLKSSPLHQIWVCNTQESKSNWILASFIIIMIKLTPLSPKNTTDASLNCWFPAGKAVTRLLMKSLNNYHWTLTQVWTQTLTKVWRNDTAFDILHRSRRSTASRVNLTPVSEGDWASNEKLPPKHTRLQWSGRK